MRLFALFSLCVALVLPTEADAAPPNRASGWSLGFGLGDPLGLSAKYRLGGADAFDLFVGSGPGLRLHGDYLFGLSRLAREPSFDLDLYLGVGPVVGVGRGWCGWASRRICDEGAFLGARVPFGIEMPLRRAPLEFGLEVAPGIAFGWPRFGGFFDAILFVRFVL